MKFPISESKFDVFASLSLFLLRRFSLLIVYCTCLSRGRLLFALKPSWAIRSPRMFLAISDALKYRFVFVDIFTSLLKLSSSTVLQDP